MEKNKQVRLSLPR